MKLNLEPISSLSIIFKDYFMLALKGTSILMGNKHEINSLILYNLGQVYMKMYYYDWAMTSFLKCLSIQKKVFGVTHKVVARTLFCIASLHFICGDKGASQRAYQLTLKIYVRAAGVNVVEVKDTIDALYKAYEGESNMNEKGSAVLNEVRHYLLKHKTDILSDALFHIMLKLGDMNTNNPLERLACYESALNFHLSQGATDEDRFCAVYTKLGEASLCAGKNMLAVGYLKKGISTLRKRWKFGVMELVESLTTLGRAYTKVDNPTKANEVLLEALNLMKKEVSSDLRRKCRIFFDLGQAFTAIEHVKEAINSMKKSVDILKGRQVVDKTFMGEVYSNFAELHLKAGNKELSLVYYEEALRVWDKSHKLRLDTIFKAGNLASASKNHHHALSLYSQILSSPFDNVAKFYAHICSSRVLVMIKDYEHTLDHLDKAAMLGKLSKDQCSLDKLSSARRAIAVQLSKGRDENAALDILRANLKFVRIELGDNNLEFVNTLADMGSVHFASMNIQEAVEYYERSLKLLKSLQPTDESENVIIQKLTQLIEERLRIAVNESRAPIIDMITATSSVEGKVTTS